VLIDEAVLQALHALATLAPLHQPHNLRGVAAARAAFPGVPQAACFDTAFHFTQPEVHQRFALPANWRGWRRRCAALMRSFSPAASAKTLPCCVRVSSALRRGWGFGSTPPPRGRRVPYQRGRQCRAVESDAYQ
jgi:hypothetical protein